MNDFRQKRYVILFYFYYIFSWKLNKYYSHEVYDSTIFTCHCSLSYNSTATDVQSTLHTAAVLEDKCYISQQQDKTYNQKDVLYFFLMFVNKPKYRTVVCTNKNIYLLLKIILSNQVEVNTGPSANTSSDSIKYPCYICNIPVLWSDKGVACDKCDQWYHAK